MKKFALLFITFTFFLASCATQRIAVLKPDISAQYLDREGFATQKSDNLDVTFGYLFSTQDHLVFEVSVKNKGTDSVRVQPEEFAFQEVSMMDSTQVSVPFKAHSLTQITRKWDERTRDRNIKTAVVLLAVVATAIAIDRSSNTKTRSRNDFYFSRNLGANLSYKGICKK
jgi:hypothetical protein